MPEPKWAWQSARVAAKSASRASSWVMTTARGIPTSAHSCQSARLDASAPSAAETTKRAASAALSPARTSPTKSGLPGASRRVSTTVPVSTVAARRPVVGSVRPRAERPGTRASTTWSKSRDFPEPLGPTRTTLRRWVGPVTVGADEATLLMAPTFLLLPPRHKRSPGPGVTGRAPGRHYAGPHHAEPIRARLLHQAADPGGRGAASGSAISPDVVTVIGTVGVCVGALAFYPRGELLVGTLVITVFVFSDTLDGIMARRDRAGPGGGAPTSTPPSTGSATPRSSAGSSSTSPAPGARRATSRPSWPAWRSPASSSAASSPTPRPAPRASG